MKKFIKHYENPNEERMNRDLIDRNNDSDLVEYLINSCKSLEVLKQIKFLGFEYTVDEKEIDINNYISSRRKKDKKDKNKKYRYLQDSRFGELKIKFHIKCAGEEKIIKKRLLVPVADENGYYTIKGKKYFLLYQLVDSSTYTNKNDLTLKSLMPVTLKRLQSEFDDVNKVKYSAPIYGIRMFRKQVDLLLFYFSKLGVSKTLEYFSVNNVIKFKNNIENTIDYLYFPINSKLYIEVNKFFFEKYTYLQSMVSMILSACSNRITLDTLEDKEYWIIRLGGLSGTDVNKQKEKGENTLTYFDRLLDETTKKILRLRPENKKNIYACLRWMLQNFNELRKKDNLDLENKRLRCNEYVASLLTKAFSERVNRVISLGNKATIKNIEDIMKFPGDLLMQNLYRSGLLKFDDRINDLDFFSKLRYTLKGPQSLGNKNDNKIPTTHRGVHPSFIGRLDLNVCGSSDPGSSGIITPFCKTDGLFFSEKHEPEEFINEFKLDINNYNRSNKKSFVTFNCKDLEDYKNVISELDENIKNCSVKKIREKKKNSMFIKINIDNDFDDL